MRRSRHSGPAAALAVLTLAATAAACTSSSSPRATGGTSTTTTPAYHPTIRPADFTADVDNPWFPLRPGSVSISIGTKDGKPARDVSTVTHTVKRIDGVPTRVVKDELYLGGRLGETTLDYYTQDASGAVWYFGEDTKSLDAQGQLVDREGSWRAGVDGAEPGVYMEAHPARGHTFRQEYYAGHAEDHFAVLDFAVPVTVPLGTYRDAMLTKEWTPLEPDVLDHKLYVRGLGQVREQSVAGPAESLSLVRYTTSAG